jgi:hypothetical protein
MGGANSSSGMSGSTHSGSGDTNTAP